MVLRRVVFLIMVAAFSALAGLVPPTGQIPGASLTDDLKNEALRTADFSTFEVPLTESLRQVSVTIGGGQGPLTDDSRFFVPFGDGSATSVRSLARRFGARGFVLQPVSTLDDPASQWVSAPDLAFGNDDDGKALDPALLLKIDAAARSVSAGAQYEMPLMTMNDGALIVTGCLAGLWTLLAAAKFIRSRRSGGLVKVERKRSRSQIV